MSPETNLLYERVCGVIARTFRLDRDGITSELGVGEIDAWDSLGHLTLMMAIEHEFSVRFSTEQIGTPKTVSEICQLLSQVVMNE